jgi:CRISPR-associated protein Csb3
MSNTISINVETTNPGQFFACCGMFEIAHRLWPGAEAWFDQTRFCIQCDGTLDELFQVFVDCDITNTMTMAEQARFAELSEMSGRQRQSSHGAEDEHKALSKLVREAPIVLRGKFQLIIDWFLDDFAGGSRFKTWAGQQSVLAIATAMKDALSNDCWRDESCLNYSSHACGLPFNFDSDLGGQGGAIDIGFSFDPLAASKLTKIDSIARPALELFAFVGLQRFRPLEIKGENLFRYAAWNQPLPIQIALPTACSLMSVAGSQSFEFRLLYRTKYLKSFLPAIPAPVLGDSDVRFEAV